MAESARLRDILDIALPAAALIGGTASPQLAQGISLAAGIADSRARGAANRQRAELAQRQIAMQEAEAERAARIAQAQEPGLRLMEMLGQSAQDVISRPELAQPFSPINMQDPLATSGPSVPIAPTAQTQFGRLSDLLSEKGGAESFAAAGGPFQAALTGRLDTGALGLREREAVLGERTQGFREKEADRQAGFTERQLTQGERKLGIQERQFQQDIKEFNQKVSGVDLVPGAIVRDEQGKEQKEWVIQDKRTGAPIGRYLGSQSEPAPTGFTLAYNDLIEASQSGDQTKTALALNAMIKEAMPKGGVTLTHDKEGNTTVTVGGSGVGGAGAQKAQRELVDQEADLLKFSSALDRFEDLTAQGQLGAGGALQKLLQSTIGQAGEVSGAVKNLIGGTFGEEAAKRKIEVVGEDGQKKELPYPKFFNKNIPQREIIANSLGFMRAALYGQTGRALSENEFKAMKQAIMQGDVNSQRAVIEVLRDEIAEAQNVLQFKSGRMGEIGGPASGLAVPVPGLERFMPQSTPAPAQSQTQTAAPPPAAEAAPTPTDAEIEAAAQQLGITVEEAKRRLGMQ